MKLRLYAYLTCLTYFGRQKAVWVTSFGSDVGKGAILGVEGSNCDFGYFRTAGGPLCKIFKLEKWPFLLIFTVFCQKKQRVSVCESFLGRFGPYFRVTAPGGVL